MGINVRAKGQTGEREIADMLNYIIYLAMKRAGHPEPECLKAMSTVQRNQNQSAVGGNDLTNCLGLSIEVKRQETLSVPAWWKQTVAAADRNKEVPVLMYRQNRKAWHVRLPILIPVPGQVVQGSMTAVGEVDIDTFKAWFSEWAFRAIQLGMEVRT
jgi:hypothetical protein